MDGSDASAPTEAASFDDIAPDDMAPDDMAPDDIAACHAETYRAEQGGPVAVASGHGVRVGVERGHLSILDGVGEVSRRRRWSRANHGLARVVVLSTAGDLSLSALKWCVGAGIGVVVIDPFSTKVLSTSVASAHDDPRIRRAQALAAGSEVGLRLARYLVATKLAGQASVATRQLGVPGASATITELSGALDDCGSLEEIRQLEAVAANVYFASWSTVRVPFVRKDLPRIPRHWQVFEGRRSAVHPDTARSATDPLNAMLNYGYRLLEAEGRLACTRMSLDPGLGVLHADLKGRDSMVLDLIEPGRPLVDRYVLELLANRPLRKADFVEDPRGVLQVRAPLTHQMAEAMPAWGMALAPVVEHVASLLGAASPYEVSVPSVLSRSKHKAAARRRVMTDAGAPPSSLGPNPGGMVPRRKARQRPRIQEGPIPPVSICPGCGGTLPVEDDRTRSRRGWCDICLFRRREELNTTLNGDSLAHANGFAEATGVRPAHTGEAKARRRSANAARRAEEQAWEAEHMGDDQDRAWFESVVLPGLGAMTLPTIARATGLSTSAASKIRAGRRVPHPRHWQALAELVGAPPGRLDVTPTT